MYNFTKKNDAFDFIKWKKFSGTLVGINFLHEGVKPSIIHHEIKSSNILLGEGFEAKVSDFGLAKLGPTGDQSHVSSQGTDRN